MKLRNRLLRWGCLAACLLCAIVTIRSQSVTYAAGELFQLADPLLRADSILFRNQCVLQARLDYPQTSIRYTTDGSEPTLQAEPFPETLVLQESTQVKVKAFHPSLQPSSTVTVQVLHISLPPPVASVHLRYAPHKNYPGTGAAALLDGRKGSLNFREPHWSGYQDQNMELTIAFSRAIQVAGVTASSLSDPSSWIFPPGGLSVSGSLDGENFRVIAAQDFPPLPAEESASLVFPAIDFPAEKVRFLKILVKTAGNIPDWHPGQGTPAWLFVDELLVNWTW